MTWSRTWIDMQPGQFEIKFGQNINKKLVDFFYVNLG